MSNLICMQHGKCIVIVDREMVENRKLHKTKYVFIICQTNLNIISNYVELCRGPVKMAEVSDIANHDGICQWDNMQGVVNYWKCMPIENGLTF